MEENVNNKLIIFNENNKTISAYFEKNEMIEVSVNFDSNVSIINNIYVGKVQNIVKNIRAAFIEIGQGISCYYSLDQDQNPIMGGESREIRVGDELIVQVAKEGSKTKAPVVSSHINITGKYTVLIHGKNIVGISNKISGRREKERLKTIAIENKPKDMGIILRTNSQDARDEIIKEEIKTLEETYHNIKDYGVYKKAFSLLYESPENYIADIRDSYSDKINEFITDDIEIYKNIESYLSNYQKEDLSKLRFYEDNLLSLDNLYGINNKIQDALKSKVWLKSGGTIVIQPTEALVAIDVNTGKAVAGKRKRESTFLKINLEAAIEIAKQLRIRNLSGIIIVDFIDMIEEENKKQLMDEFNKILKQDPIKTTLIDMTALGLVEITRKKIRRPLYEQIKD